MAARRSGPGAFDPSSDFDLTGSDSFDDPTELPGPWTPPPDPEFMTGTLPQIDRADLSAGLVPGIEPADSPKETVRFSRHEMQELFAPRLQARQPRAVQPAAPPLPAPRAARPAPAPQPLEPPAVAAPATAAPPPHAATQVASSPEVRLEVAHRWRLHHVALAFAIGVLTGVLATTFAVLASQ